jgi:TPR repeat protein
MTFLLFWLGSAALLNAQPTDAERALFEQTRVRAEKGEAQAQLELGTLYANGTGVAKDPKKAARWHRKAADQGLARAQYQFALDCGQGVGVKPDKVEAAKWLARAAEQGLAEAQVNLGLCYCEGDGVRLNTTEAARWFRKAAEQAMAYGQYELGMCYLDGTGVAKDILEGVKWNRQAADQGFALAQNQLGLCYEKGIGVTKDNLEAYKWFNLAAAQDDYNAADIRVSMAKVETLLTPEQVAQAQRLAHEFKPVVTPPPGSANSSTNTSTLLIGLQTGMVNVEAEDGACEIFVDDKFVGNAPAKLKLNAGAHAVEVRKAGCKPYRRDLQVSAGADLTLRAVLEKQ